uniref:Uncharacterized protein n=1 Tax=Steinernema glaseri TaxID=37863 RepID=A0A1I7Z7P8_9BILA
MERPLAVLLLLLTLIGVVFPRPVLEVFGKVEGEQIEALSSKVKAIEKRGGGDCGFHDNCDRKRGGIEEWPSYDTINSNIFVKI